MDGRAEYALKQGDHGRWTMDDGLIIQVWRIFYCKNEDAWGQTYGYGLWSWSDYNDVEGA